MVAKVLNIWDTAASLYYGYCNSQILIFIFYVYLQNGIQMSVSYLRKPSSVLTCLG